MNNINNIIRYLTLSDIHLGNKNTKIEEMIMSLKKFFLQYGKHIKNMDYIFLSGDTYDRLLNNGSKEAILALQWLMDLAEYCFNNNIKLRILEGTRSHDFGQVSNISAVIEKKYKGLDFKYIVDHSIETCVTTGLSIMYLPDDLYHDGSLAYSKSVELLSQHHMDKADIGIFHGSFNYQLPIVTIESAMDEKLFMKLFNYFITIGHIHKHSVYSGKIIAPGSFERIAHAEEEPKGAVVHVIYPNGDKEYSFLVNENAVIYHHIDVHCTSVDMFYKTMKKRLRTFPINTRFRLGIEKSNPLAYALKEISDMFPNYIFTKKDIGGVEETKVLEDMLDEYSTITIGAGTVIELMEKELKSKGDTDITQKLILLKEVVDAME